jgi:hypothetical protein
MTTKIHNTPEGTFIVYDSDDDFEYDEFLTLRDARDFIANLDDICSDTSWADTNLK